MAENQKIVLVVDDDPSVISFISLLLKKDGYEVLAADSGYNAYSLLEKRFQGLGELKIDLILTDWVMQGWDGIRLLSEVRMRPYRDVPIILMSGAVTREQLLDAAKSRADGILVKPIDKAVLVQKVGDTIAKRRNNSA